MAFLTANLSFRISLQVQSRSLLISSVARKDYNTSVTVRYVPKTQTLKENAQKAPHLEGCEKKEGNLLGNIALKGKSGAPKVPKFDEKERLVTSFCAEYSNSSDIPKQAEELSEFEDASSSDLELTHTDAWSQSEMILDQTSVFDEDRSTEGDKLLATDISQEAEKLALRFLAARAVTEYELQKKLRGKKYPPNVVESVIADIKGRGLINDGFYAESFSRSRWLSSTWGPRRIKQALSQKGVNKVEVEKAMKLVFQGGDDLDRDGQSAQHGMSKLAMDHLFLQASKQWVQGGQNTSYENRKARIIRWLQYRGFNWGITNFILKKLEAHNPP